MRLRRLIAGGGRSRFCPAQDASAGPELPEPADPIDLAVCRGRRQRRARPHRSEPSSPIVWALPSSSRTGPGAGAVIGITALAPLRPRRLHAGAERQHACGRAARSTRDRRSTRDKDFAPVALVAHYPFLLVATASLPVKLGGGAHPLRQGEARRSSVRVARRRDVAAPLRRAVQGP